MKKVIHFDEGEIIGRLSKTSEGYLKGNAVVTRTGIFKYRNIDGSIRRELRHPNEVFKPKSLNTLKMIPITNNHPPTRTVNADTAKRFVIGMTGENIDTDNEKVIVSLLITNKDDIKSVENGKRGLSCGYNLDLLEDTGIFEGEKYDCIQRNIEYNHVAIVKKGRAGNIARLNIDSWENSEKNDSYMVDNNIDNDRTDNNNPKHKKGAKAMPKLNIKNIDYDAEQEVINEFLELKTSYGTLHTEMEKVKKTNIDLQAKLDSANDEAEKRKNELPDTINSMVQERVTLQTCAINHLDESIIKNIENMSNIDIKKELVLKRFPNAKEKLNQDDETYINARYDAAIEILEDEKSDKVKAEQRKKANPKRNSDSDDNRTSHEKFVDSIENRWQDKE